MTPAIKSSACWHAVCRNWVIATTSPIPGQTTAAFRRKVPRPYRSKRYQEHPKTPTSWLIVHDDFPKESVPLGIQKLAQKIIAVRHPSRFPDPGPRQIILRQRQDEAIWCGGFICIIDSRKPLALSAVTVAVSNGRGTYVKRSAGQAKVRHRASRG
jgi:hypothetical protein